MLFICQMLSNILKNLFNFRKTEFIFEFCGKNFKNIYSFLQSHESVMINHVNNESLNQKFMIIIGETRIWDLF